MKKIVILLLTLQGVLMATTIKEIQFLDTNIPVVFEEGRYIPIVSIQLVFKNAGHLSSTKDGLASLSAEILNEGTKKDGSVRFATKLDSHAIEIGSHVGRESFVIEVSSLKSEFGYAIDKLVELLKDPNYTEEALSLVKHQKLGWLKQKTSDFDYIAGTNLRKMLFKDTPLARAYNGSEESIASISIEDIESFISSKLGYNNMIALVGGDIEFKEAQKYLNRLIEIFPKVKLSEIKTIVASNKKETKELYEETQQAYIYFGSPFNFSYDSQNQHKAQIAEYLLGGGGFGSRLMEEIRVKRGLTYGVYASLRQTKSASYLSGYMQTKLSKQKEATKLIQSVVDEFVKDGITQKELDETKQFLLGSEPLRTETLSQRLHRAYNDYYNGRPLGFSTQKLKKIESVTLEEMNEFIKSHKELRELSFSIVTKKK
ncbi:MAG: pitrilysin family protein [Sulfurovum sp.]